MNNYIIVIPSYQRSIMLHTHTLLLLDSYNIPHKNIHILLENEKEQDDYSLSADYNILLHYQKGIGNVRQFIRNFYKYNTDHKYIVCLDDDINEIRDYKDVLKDLNKFILNMFKHTEEQGLNYWGVSNYHNTFYMKEEITTGLKYIAAAFTGTIIDRKKEIINVSYNTLEDFVSSCEYFLRDGGIVRHNSVWLKTKYFNPGGIQSQYGSESIRKLAMEKDSLIIKDDYGPMVKRIKKSWGYDLQINSRFRLC